MKSLTHHRGQTLLEAIIAVGVIVISVTAAMTLIVSSIIAGRISQTKVEAANFAREGIEIIRATRDGNWMKRDQNIADGTDAITHWDDDGLQPGYASLGDTTAPDTNGRCFYPLFNVSAPAGNSWILHPVANGVNPCTSLAQDSYPKIYSVRNNSTDPIQYFTQLADPGDCPIGKVCVATTFRRSITVKLVTNEQVTFPTSGATKTLSYLDVVSTVSWDGFVGTSHLVAEERLYDWR